MPPDREYTTHPKVVAGVVLIASVLLFTLIFWIVMAVSWAVSPPADTIVGTVQLKATTADYFTTGRVAISAIAGAVLTWVIWKVAEGEAR